jgi:hypothetical protein
VGGFLEVWSDGGIYGRDLRPAGIEVLQPYCTFEYYNLDNKRIE